VAIAQPADQKTVFRRVEYDVAGLLEFIDMGDIGLPDIQRPFVWSAAKVRDLFDSMYRGFPVGYLLLWENANVDRTRAIGTDRKQHRVPGRLIVDGQQRLTSLYAVFRGKAIVDANYRETKIGIAFRPRDGTFDVTDAAIRRDPEYIADISEMWASGKSSHSLINRFIGDLRAHRQIDEDEEELISHSLDRLFDLRRYPFTALEIAATVPEEQVADIFVRINSEGVKLNQADFILTLMSVFWDEGRADLEHFCRASRVLSPGPASPFNHFFQPDPDQLLRSSVAVGFRRARLEHVYSILRGKDLESGHYSPESRDQQFLVLRAAQSRVLDVGLWHEFWKVVLAAGFRDGSMISSQTNLVYAYAMYLIGRHDFGVPQVGLRQLMARWFFMIALTGRYSGSSETIMESDLNRLRGVSGADAFTSAVDRQVQDTLTDDFWSIGLPNELTTTGARSPYLLAYHAALNLLGARILFSKLRVSELFDPALKSTRAALERHHLYPKAFLRDQGIESTVEVNQVANLAFVEWPDNADISDRDPTEYWPAMCNRYLTTQGATSAELDAMVRWHALPSDWTAMEYLDFLNARRRLMARVVREGFESLLASQPQELG